MKGKKLNELTSSNSWEAYKKYKSVIEIVRWGWVKFWWIIFIILLIIYFLILPEEYKLTDKQINFLVIWLVFSIWMIANRIWYEEGFKDWYEFGHQDGTKWAVKELNNLTNKDLEIIEEMESLAEAEKPKKKKK